MVVVVVVVVVVLYLEKLPRCSEVELCFYSCPTTHNAFCILKTLLHVQKLN